MIRRCATAIGVAIGAVVIALGAVIAPASAHSGNDCVPSREPVRDVSYRMVTGPGAALTKLDIHPAPEGCDTPVVVWVHGGGWRIGDKAQGQANKVQLFNSLGYTYVSVNYRLTDAGAAEPIRFPVHQQDVAAAVAWVHEHIARYGGDPNEIALLGHSAGAQLVALLGTDERYLERHDLGLDDLACVAPLDTEGFDVSAAAVAPRREGQIYQAAFGTDPKAWRKASAIEYVDKGKDIPSMLLVERGTPRRMAFMTAFADALRDAGVEVTVVDVGTYTHADVNREIGRPNEQIMTPPLTTFLADCFGRDA